jgi:hypothetical protein
VVELNYVPLFEAKFNFGPLVHPEIWPSYFDPDPLTISENHASGIPQRWRLGSLITSVASDEIIVKGADMIMDQPNSDTDFRVLESSEPEDQLIMPESKFDKSFQVLTQKFSLDDRRPSIPCNQLDPKLRLCHLHYQDPCSPTQHTFFRTPCALCGVER